MFVSVKILLRCFQLDIKQAPKFALVKYQRRHVPAINYFHKFQ